MYFRGSISMRTIVTCVVACVLVSCENPYARGEKKDGGVEHTDGGLLPPGEQAQLSIIARAFTTFHSDTGGWPFTNRVWWADNRDGDSTQINGTAFTTTDTALFTIPPANLTGAGGCTPGLSCAVPQCIANQTTRGSQSPCWNGPYLSPGSNMGSMPWLDTWGRPRMYAYLAPANGSGGGNIGAPNGLIFIWSRGPDGKDSFTCSDASCIFNYTKFDQGQPSGEDSDDIIVEVSDTAY
jgi:hypothetical protein